MRVVKEFTKGFTTELPPFRLVLGLCPSLAVTTLAEKRFGYGHGHHVRAGVLEHPCLDVEKDRSFEGPDRVLYRLDCDVRGHGGVADAGVLLSTVSEPRDFRPSDRRQLHHPRAGGSLRIEKQRALFGCGRTGCRARFYPFPDGTGGYSRAARRRDVFSA